MELKSAGRNGRGTIGKVSIYGCSMDVHSNYGIHGYSNRGSSNYSGPSLVTLNDCIWPCLITGLHGL